MRSRWIWGVLLLALTGCAAKKRIAPPTNVHLATALKETR